MNATDYLNRSALYRKLVYGPYREFARVYAAKMSNEGLGRQCTWRSLSLFRDLMDWHIGNGHAPQDLSEVYVDRFLEHRFKHWSPDTGDRSALRRLLSALREEGLIPAALPVERTEHEQIVDAFGAYLSNERGLAASTVGSHKLLSLRFLREVCPAGANGFAALTPEIVIGYAHHGAHLFRHSLATDLLRSGASFAEIGQLLRHRSIDSTRIYAKLDIEKLRELSLPWPGGVQ